MAAHMGAAPESPRPFSVISEGYQDQLNIPFFDDRYSFGEAYETRMMELVHRFLELGTDDRFCYVGDARGSLAPRIQEHFCLLEPVLSVNPGHFHYEETPKCKMLPFRIAYTGAEEYFRTVAQNPDNLPLFDRVLLKDAIPYFASPKETYMNIMSTISEYGKIMIVHRPQAMNTLPIFSDARHRFAETEDHYIQIVKDLQTCGFDVQWEIESVPIIMPKVKWLAMLKEKFPPQMDIISNFEVMTGIRELSEGVLKYEGDMVEFQDRLLFVTASRPMVETGYPSINRIGRTELKPYPGMQDLHYKLEITPDIKPFVPLIK
ncbi:uncharacterized protein LOC135502746 [Lineus longissimus]|uniref:uncharacterized protein LOC135502746 n=1 Tax=Lineus longissimus TaxID=88925 RepID=UPI00315C5A79